MTLRARWNPIRDMLTLQEQMDNLFGRSPNTSSAVSSFSVQMDVLENDEAFMVIASVPGITEEQLDITLNQNVLTIKGELMPTYRPENAQYHLRERPFGRFTRSLRLPSKLDPDAIEANLENGLLIIMVPKAEESKPLRINIGDSHRDAIEGSFVEESNGA